MKFVPHNYQKYGIDRLLMDKSLGLFLDMGLGKTVITLTAINDLKYNRFSVSKVLVIAPKKVAQNTWSSEAQKWDHLKMLRVVPVLGTLKQRIKALNTPADVYVINRENVSWLVEYFRNAWPFDMVVADEFSSFKNPKSKRFKSLTWVRQKIDRFVGLTGTPAPNGLLDLWAQVYLLDEGKRLGKRIGQFRERYFEPDQRSREQVFNYKPKPGADEAIQNLIGDICISMKAEDYLTLPDCTSVTVPVILDGKAKEAYERLEKEAVLEIDPETTIDAGTAAVLTNKLLQLCNGAVYTENREIAEIHNCKIEAFLEVVEALNGKPALVFYNFQHDLVRIKKALEPLKLEVRELKTPQDERDWNDKKIDILLAHPASCAYGLNLQQGGNHVIWFGLNWSLELYQQANKRLHRQGQTEKVIIHHLVVKGGVDEDVMAALDNKSGLQESLMQSLKARIERYKGDEVMKSHIRDYATEAFRFYAKVNMSADEYKQKIYDEALFNYTKKMKGAGISCPTESAIIAAENEINEKLAEIKDLEAVEMTLAMLKTHAVSENNFCRVDQTETVEAIKTVYFTDPDKELEKGDIQDRVHKAEINIPASERSIYYYLAKARELFAQNRGLRI